MGFYWVFFSYIAEQGLFQSLYSASTGMNTTTVLAIGPEGQMKDIK